MPSVLGEFRYSSSRLPFWSEGSSRSPTSLVEQSFQWNFDVSANRTPAGVARQSDPTRNQVCDSRKIPTRAGVPSPENDTYFTKHQSRNFLISLFHYFIVFDTRTLEKFTRLSKHRYFLTRTKEVLFFFFRNAGSTESFPAQFQTFRNQPVRRVRFLERLLGQLWRNKRERSSRLFS